MNKRIQQLANEAGLLFQRDKLSYEELKFAELIVKECANQVDWILAEGGKTQGDLIKERFGVEQ